MDEYKMYGLKRPPYWTKWPKHRNKPSAISIKEIIQSQ